MLLHDVTKQLRKIGNAAETAHCTSHTLLPCCSKTEYLLVFSSSANIMPSCCHVHDFYQQPLQWMLLMLCPIQQTVARKTHSCGPRSRKIHHGAVRVPRVSSGGAALCAGCLQRSMRLEENGSGWENSWDHSSQVSISNHPHLLR